MNRHEVVICSKCEMGIHHGIGNKCLAPGELPQLRIILRLNRRLTRQLHR